MRALFHGPLGRGVLGKAPRRPFSRMNAAAAVLQVKSKARARFDETVEIAVRLGIDPRKPNQNIRSVAQLPFGTGKTVRVAVFAKDPKLVEEAQSAGADVIGAEDLVASIQGGTIDFDRCVATPDMMPVVGRVARVSVIGSPPSPHPSLMKGDGAAQILGPRGMMPNPKLGTVTTNVLETIQVGHGYALSKCHARDPPGSAGVEGGAGPISGREEWHRACWHRKSELHG